MKGIELYRCKNGLTSLNDRIVKNDICIDFKHFLKKKYSNTMKLELSGELHKMYVVSIKMSVCYNIDTLEMYDFNCSGFGWIGMEQIDCSFFNDVFKTLLEENNWGESTGYSVEIWNDCFNHAVEETRVNKGEFEYYFYFETIEQMLDFIKYYDSTEENYNILEDYYHIIFTKNRDYKNYLMTKHWQNRRVKALKDAKYKCQLCSRKDELHVHHNTYKNIGNEKKEDLIVLCKKCHSKFHDIKQNMV